VKAGAPLAAMLALAACARSPAPAPAPIEVELDEVAAHHLSESPGLHDVAGSDGSGQIWVRVVVDAGGRVVSARAETGTGQGGRAYPAPLMARAAALVRRWRYRPFTRGGAAIPVTFAEIVTLLPPEDRPARHIAMPSYDAGFRIRLERTACFGLCPVYSVEVAANGDVVFQGEDYVFVRGRHRTRIDPAAVRRLYDLARRADFYSLRDSYALSATDAATYIVTILSGGWRKSVADYIGASAGLPDAVTDLENAIDAAAQTGRWIEGDETVVPALLAERFDFRSYEGARMLAAAAAAGKARIVAQLVGAGAPLTAASPDGFREPVAVLPMAARAGNRVITTFLLSRRTDWSQAELLEALNAAAAGGSYDTFRLLAQRGALARMTPVEASQLLRLAARSGDPRVVAAILALHPDVNRVERDSIEHPVLADAAGATCNWDRPPPGCEPAVVVALLLRAGANPRIVNPRVATSPLVFVGDVRIARLLLAAGADPNFADLDGKPPIFAISNEEVALAMLEAGANPRARRPGDRMTLVGWARYQQWPRVLARLRAQGVRG
jgi:hypothetical protein